MTNSSSYLEALVRNASSSTTARWGRTSSATTSRPRISAGKSLEGCNDHLVLTRPDVIQAIHESFLAVGCDVVETCTFQSTPRRLAEWGLGDKAARDERRAAAQLARAACRQIRDARTSRASSPARSARRGCCRRARDPALSQHHLRRARRELLRAGEVPRRGRRRRPAHRDVAGHPRGEGGGRRHSSGCSPSSADACRSRRRSRST